MKSGKKYIMCHKCDIVYHIARQRMAWVESRTTSTCKIGARGNESCFVRVRIRERCAKESESDWLQGCPFSSPFESKHEQPYFVFIGADVLFVQVTFQLTSVPTVVCFAANCFTATWSTMAPLVECHLVFFDVPHAVKDHLPCDKMCAKPKDFAFMHWSN